MKDERWDVIEILYGTAALADLPPVKLIALELDVPERTASDWIQKARGAGPAGRHDVQRRPTRRVVNVLPLRTTLVAVDHTTAAATLGLSASRLRHHVRLGDLTPHFSGTKPLYLISDLEQFVERLPTRPEHLPVI